MFHYRIDSSLALRSLVPDDAETLCALVDANRVHLRRWLDWVDAATEPRHVCAFCAKAQKREAAGKAIVAAIRMTGRIVGLIELREIDVKRRDAELGYWLDASAQGKGVMTGAVGAMLAHAFDGFGLHQVFAGCAADNRRSRRLLERNRFRQVGIRRGGLVLHEQAVDLVMYAAASSQRPAAKVRMQQKVSAL